MAVIQFYDSAKYLPQGRDHGDIIAILDDASVLSDSEKAQNGTLVVKGTAAQYRAELAKLSIQEKADDVIVGPRFRVSDQSKIELAEVSQAITVKAPTKISALQAEVIK